MITLERCVQRVVDDLKNRASSARTHETALKYLAIADDLEAAYSKLLEDSNFYT